MTRRRWLVVFLCSIALTAGISCLWAFKLWAFGTLTRGEYAAMSELAVQEALPKKVTAIELRDVRYSRFEGRRAPQYWIEGELVDIAAFREMFAESFAESPDGVPPAVVSKAADDRMLPSTRSRIDWSTAEHHSLTADGRQIDLWHSPSNRIVLWRILPPDDTPERPIIR